MTYESVTVPVGRDRRIWTALRANQIARFATMPSEKEVNVIFTCEDVIFCAKARLVFNWCFMLKQHLSLSYVSGCYVFGAYLANFKRGVFYLSFLYFGFYCYGYVSFIRIVRYSFSESI